MKYIAFFNYKSGSGKPSLVYHLAAFSAHAEAVRDCRDDFLQLAGGIGAYVGIAVQ